MVKDLSYNLKFIESTEEMISNLETAPVTNGQYIVCVDSANIYYDSNGERNLISDVILLDDDEARTGLEKPIKKLYYVNGTNHLWFYNGTWIDLTVEESELGNHVVVSGEQPEGQKTNDIWLKTITE